PEVLLQLSQLRADKAERIRQTELTGASEQAGVLAAEFENDVLLLRWARAQTAHPGNGPPLNLDSFMKGLTDKLNGERARMVSLMGLPTGTTLDALASLVPEFVPGKDASGGVTDLAGKLITDIRAKQIDSIRRTLFENGLPQGLGDDDDLMSQIKANTIADRMSYKGFTPVAAAGLFRGTVVSGGFLEAPDPREIERALENVMSDVLRKQMESDGRLHDLALHLNQLMSQVSDGGTELEAQRREIEAAESDLKARTALATDSSGRLSADPKARGEMLAAQQRLLDDWSQFGTTMVNTKSAFISLVTELEALGQGSAGSLRPFEAPLQPEARSTRLDSRSQLLDYWTERMADPAFAAREDELLAATGAAVPADARARINAAADLYRQALQDGNAVRDNDFSAPEKLDLLTRNDAEGKRLLLRGEIERAVSRLGALDPHSSPAAAGIIAFFRDDAEKSAEAGTASRAQKRAVAEELRKTFLDATTPSPAVSAAFDRLEKLDASLDDKREALLTDYLTSAGDDPKNFVLKDLALDDYLKAQSAFDEELAATLASPAFQSDPGMARVLDGLYDVRASLARAVDQAKSGRGMAAMDALIMLEETRLRAARWGGRPPAEIDRVAEALQDLRDTRAAWADKTKDSGLEPLYALTRLDADGKRTWTVDEWLTLKDVQSRLQADKDSPAAPNAVIERDGRLFIDNDTAHPGVRYELIGGVDAAKAEADAASRDLGANSAALDLAARMKDSDFVAVGGEDAQGQPRASQGLSFSDVFVGAAGKPSLYAQGRLFFFDSASKAALNPLAALSLPPEKVVIMYYGGDQPLSRDRFPTLQSLDDSDAAKDFRTLSVSPNGAAQLAEHARSYEEAQLRRGWLEVKLNSFGFARDENGRVTQLYRTKDDFEAQWKAYDHAERDLADAKQALADAQADEAARKDDADKAQAAYTAAMRDFSAVRNSPEAQKANAAQEKAAQEVKDEGSSNGPAKKDFDIAVRKYQAVLDASPAKKVFDKAAKAQKDAVDKYRQAKAKTVNASKTVDDAVATLAHSKAWTLYRASDLALSLDGDRDVVRAAAPAARGALALNQDVAGGGPAESRLTGELSAAVVDGDGRLVKAYATGADVDAAAPNWTLLSLAPDGDVDARMPDGSVRTKVRISHYEEKDVVGGKTESLPVLLSERYLIERLDDSKSKLSTANHWAIMPYNWGSIVLEIPRDIAQSPAEILGGRDLNSSHYLGRAQMYKTEGGETEHHGFFRAALGWVDVLNLLPDPVARYYDPSQFPDSVQVNSPLTPGQILADKGLRDGDHDVKFGSVAMVRQVRQASEDLDAARERTLARFNGGVEEATIETRRGRAGDYQESSVSVRSGEVKSALGMVSAVDQRLDSDPALAASAGADGSRDFTASATPGALFVDRVSRRVTVYPGAAGYEREAQAMKGYGDRVAQRDAAAAKAKPGLEAAQAQADVLLKGRVSDRDKALKDEQDTWNKFHTLAERIGIQEELERRMAVLQAEIKDLKAQLAWWTNYAAQLDAARSGGGPVIPGPGQPGRPGQPGQPGNPWGGNPMFWAWMLALFGLSALLAALWHGLIRRPRAS
ncbi:MAG TPA: hypothetical protein VH309_13360, partial [Elusimicrobiota bacterium]|nr:hypothetical protein [Elusimicrobiota bacterium]